MILLYGLAAHCISLYQYYLEQSTSRFCHWAAAAGAAISLFSPVFCGNVSAFVHHTVSLASKKWILPGRTKKNTLSSSSAFLILVLLLQFLPEPWRIQSCGSGSVILRDFFVSAGRAFQKKRSKAGVCADGAHVVPAEEAVTRSQRQMQVIDRKCHDLKYQVAAMRTYWKPGQSGRKI